MAWYCLWRIGIKILFVFPPVKCQGITWIANRYVHLCKQHRTSRVTGFLWTCSCHQYQLWVFQFWKHYGLSKMVTICWRYLRMHFPEKDNHIIIFQTSLRFFSWKSSFSTLILIQDMALHGISDKPLPDTKITRFKTHVCVTRRLDCTRISWCVNSMSLLISDGMKCVLRIILLQSMTGFKLERISTCICKFSWHEFTNLRRNEMCL